MKSYFLVFISLSALLTTTFLPPYKISHLTFSYVILIFIIRNLGYDSESDTTLVECRPITGRTHQLRLHLQSTYMTFVRSYTNLQIYTVLFTFFVFHHFIFLLYNFSTFSFFIFYYFPLFVFHSIIQFFYPFLYLFSCNHSSWQSNC